MDEPNVVTQAPDTTDAPRISQLQAVIGAFTRPRATFERMRAKPHFLLATLILIAAPCARCASSAYARAASSIASAA